MTRLKQVMKSKNVSEKELAAELFMTRQGVSRYVCGAMPRIDIAFKIADYLDEDCRKLFEVKDGKDKSNS